MSIIEKVRARKNAPPASPASLSAQIADLNDEIGDLSAEQAELDGNPSHLHADAVARLAELNAILPIKERALAALRQSLNEAQKHEEVEALRAHAKRFQQDTTRAAKTFSARYTAAAETFAAVLKELADNKAEATRIAAEGQRLGVPSACPHLEAVVRGDELQRGWRWLQDQVVLDVHGRVIAEG